MLQLFDSNTTAGLHEIKRDTYVENLYKILVFSYLVWFSETHSLRIVKVWEYYIISLLLLYVYHSVSNAPKRTYKNINNVKTVRVCVNRA